MKTKDIALLIGSVLVIVFSIYFLVTTLAPKKNTSTQSTQNQVKETFSDQIDTETLNKIKQLKDYGEGALDNIGRVDPFASLN